MARWLLIASKLVEAPMIARLWQTKIDEARGIEYDTFADTYSRRMFAELPGCLGALFLGTGEVRSVLSLWTDRAAIEALETSARYIDTVTRFQATGILREPREVQLFDVVGGLVDSPALTEEFAQLHPAAHQTERALRVVAQLVAQ